MKHSSSLSYGDISTRKIAGSRWNLDFGFCFEKSLEMYDMYKDELELIRKIIAYRDTMISKKLDKLGYNELVREKLSREKMCYDHLHPEKHTDWW